MRRSHKLLTAMASQTYAQKVSGIFGSNLVGYWPLNELTGTTAIDRSATGANGTYGAAVTLAAAAGPGPSMGLAPSFPGAVNGNITFAAGSLTALNGAWNPDEFTVSAWFKMDTVAHWNDANNYTLWTIGVSGNYCIVLWKAGANAFYFTNTINGVTNERGRTGLTTLNWINVVGVGSRIENFRRFYFNGSQVGTDIPFLDTDWIGTLTSSFTQIGSQNNANYCPGFADQFIIAKVAATSAQVAKLAVPA